MALSAEGLIALVVLFNEDGGAFDERERQAVALFVVVGPVDETVLGHHQAPERRVSGRFVLHEEAKLEARSKPRNPAHIVSEDFIGELSAAPRRSDRDHRGRMHMIDVSCGKEAVQRGVDGARARIQVVGAMGEESHHVVLGDRLRALVRPSCVHLSQDEQLGHLKGREVGRLGRAQIPAGAFHPQNVLGLAAKGAGLQ